MKVTRPVGVPASGETAATVAVNVTAWPDTDGFWFDFKVVVVLVVVVLALSTTCDSGADVLPVKLLSPPYAAVIECVAAESAAVLNVASAPISVTVSRVVVPSLKVTIPDGEPVPGATAATVAVKVTARPKTEGLADELIVMLLMAWLTV